MEKNHVIFLAQILAQRAVGRDVTLVVGILVLLLVIIHAVIYAAIWSINEIESIQGYRKNNSYHQNMNVMNKEKDKLQTRRDFFKKSAKAILPIIGGIVLTAIPFKSNAHESKPEMGCISYCGYSCSAACGGTCSGTCVGTCAYTCIGTCVAICNGSCSGSCIQLGMGL